MMDTRTSPMTAMLAVTLFALAACGDAGSGEPETPEYEFAIGDCTTHQVSENMRVRDFAKVDCDSPDAHTRITQLVPGPRQCAEGEDWVSVIGANPITYCIVTL